MSDATRRDGPGLRDPRVASRVRGEDGWVLVPTMALLMITLALGLAMLSVVDTQAQQSGRQRVAESSFNLAEGTANAAAAVIADGWPARSTATCALPMAEGGLDAPADPVTVPERIRAILASSYADGDYGDGASWEIHLCDDVPKNNAVETWTDEALTRPAWDANRNGQLWIRAQATVRGRRQAMARLVKIGEIEPLPTGFALIAGQLSFTSSLTTTLNSLLSNELLPLVNSIVSGGKIGVRCGILPSLCTQSVETALGTIPLTDPVLGNRVEQYPRPTVLTAARLAELRLQAQETGTYISSSIADGQPCFAASNAPEVVVFVEQVGVSGDGTCTVPASSRAVVIVAKGRMAVPAGVTFNGVLLALHQQTPQKASRRVITLGRKAVVRGAVFADLGGTVAVYPPDGGLVSGLVSNLLNVLTGYGPAITYDADKIAAVKAHGPVAPVRQTYMQIAPHAH